MPELTFVHVVSVSSENKNYPAENLLKCESFKKWKSGAAGERQVTVTLQLEKASCIHKIDVGNEGSAFVEVLVGKAAMKDEEYQVILVASSFMNPVESRNGQNMNRVRLFTQDNLSAAATNEKWDRVKVVCTQPFNKAVQYGLSFIKLHSPADASTQSTAQITSQHLHLGAFSVNAAGGDTIKAGSLFHGRGMPTATKEKSQTLLTGAAAVRAASKLVENPHQQRNAVSTSPGHKTADTLSHGDIKDNVDSASRTPRANKHQASRPSSASRSAKEHSSPVAKRAKVESNKPMQSFKDIMKKVVFVMSGFQNPQRSDLREKALQMGARYCADWKDGCTHLICAFSGTPKYEQVKGKGKIVKKEWIIESYRNKCSQPWRKFRLGKASSPASTESDDDDEQEKAKSSTRAVSAVSANVDREDVMDIFDSGEDTEEEVSKLQESKRSADTSRGSTDGDDGAQNVGGKMVDPYTESTDDELPQLPNFFRQKHFLLYGEMSTAERHNLARYITAYNGSLDEYMNGKIDFVITGSIWDKTFDEALSDNPRLTFVQPKWVYACHGQQRLIPHQKYSVAPASM